MIVMIQSDILNYCALSCPDEELFVATFLGTGFLFLSKVLMP